MTKNITRNLPTLPALPKNRAKSMADCYCGCGGQTQSTFVAGHDGRLKGLIMRVIRGAMTLDDVKEWGGEKALKGLNRGLNDKQRMHAWGLTDEVTEYNKAAADEAREATAQAS